MKIAVVGTSRSGTDPKVVRLVVSLVGAGHTVAFVAPGEVDDLIAESVDRVVQIDTRWPEAKGAAGKRLRRANPERFRRFVMHRRLARFLDGFEPDLVYALNRGFAEFVDGLGHVNAFDGNPPDDVRSTLAMAAPRDPAAAGLTVFDERPWVEREMSTPQPGRHRGRRIVLCYHPTETTPARYLHRALERAGVEVDHRYPDVDLDAVGEGTDAVVFVESPYPALDVQGRCRVPLLYWVHHGEIHLNQNIRLARRYRADIVLLAHSWHLAHRFGRPAAPFPFGVPTEMLPYPKPFTERGLAVSMIAAGFDGTGDRYAQRRALAAAIIAEFGSERTMFAGGLDPTEMFAVYGDSRVVIDEGGSRHRPVTMRVFEATGSGAALATLPGPGLDLMFRTHEEFAILDPDDAVASVVATDDLESVAAAGNRRALGSHTYDHRVDELFAIVDETTPEAADGDEPAAGGIAAVLSEFAEIDSVACVGRYDELTRRGYLVYPLEQVSGRGGVVDVVVVDDAVPAIADAVALAHRYIVASPDTAGIVDDMLSRSHRRSSRSDAQGMAVFDLLTPGYIVRDV